MPETTAEAIGRLADEFKRFNDMAEAAAKRPPPKLPAPDFGEMIAAGKKALLGV